MPGQLISGFVEQTRSGYQSAQLIGWDAIDLAHALHFTPDFVPRAGDLTLMPKAVARLPLLGANGYQFPANPLISNSVRLELPTLDISVWRQKAAAAGTPRVSEFVWSDNHSLMGPIPEDAHFSVSQAGSPRSIASLQPQPKSKLMRPPPAFNRPPPVNNRHMQMRNVQAYSSAASSLGDGMSRLSLSDRPESVKDERLAQHFDIAPSSCDPLGVLLLMGFKGLLRGLGMVI